MGIDIIKEQTICLTGHRPKFLPWGYDESGESCLRFKEYLRKVFVGVIDLGKTTFLIGMAEGFDMIGAEVLLKLRKKHNIQIIAVVPCVGQEIKWKLSQQKRYKKILKKCDDIITLNDYYTPNCMNDRNKYMIDCSSFCLACWNGKPSGTGNTVRLAKQKGLKVRIINPENFR